MTPPVVLVSLWRNDAARALPERAAHLLAKTYPALRWLWVVGDSTDATTDHLAAIAAADGRDITVLDLGDTGAVPATPEGRLVRLSRTVNAALAQVRATDAVVCCHESDLLSPPDVVERLLAPGHACMGAWPMLRGLAQACFYDTWAVRGLDGRTFTNHPPYHPEYRADAPFEVSSFGSVYLFPAAAVRRGLRADTLAVVDLAHGLRAQGYPLWVDPTCEVVQPAALWTPLPFPREALPV